MRLELCTWPEVEAYLVRSRGVIVPLGSTEQHGPNGLIGTDAICARAIADRAGEIADALVAPTLSYGVAPFNLGFPGTVSLRAATFTAVLLDCLHSLARHGFERIYCLNGHGGNIAPAQSAFSELYSGTSFERGERSPPRCTLVSWWQYPHTDALRKDLYGDLEGLHATPSEVSITQHSYPESARMMALSPVEALRPHELQRMAGDSHFDAEHHRARYPDGRIGSAPERATPEAGRRLLELAAAEAAKDVERFFQDN